MSDDAPPRAAPGSDWARLHPLSPLLRGGRALAGLVVVVGSRSLQQRQDDRVSLLVDVGAVVLAVLAAFVSWLVTRWRLRGTELQIETGLLRRQSIRVPLSRVQSVDIVRPLLARALGMAEVRVEVAGRGSGHGRLAYLTERHAGDVRARLLAVAHGLHEETPEPAERHVLTMSNARLVAVVAMACAGIAACAAVLVVAVGVTAGLAAVPGTLGATATTAFGVLAVQLRRLTTEFSFTLAEAPDGLRLRSGLLGTTAETIPAGRVQAVRWIEPVTWRPFGWVRLEVDVARQHVPRRGSDGQSARASRALLPVGTREEAAWLLSRVLPDATVRPPSASRPPGRAAVRAPLSYPVLRAWHDDHHVVTRTGRLRRTTIVVPMGKVQSIRWEQGPLQRLLRLATVRADTAGRNWQAVALCRDAGEADRLVASLTERARAARRGQARSPAP